jgi:hypothetical protein
VTDRAENNLAKGDGETMKSTQRCSRTGRLVRRHLPIVGAMCVGLFASALAMAQGNPFAGTWKLNTARSHFDPGPAPTSQTRTWDADGKVFVKGINAAGKPTTHTFTVKPDCKAYPSIGAKDEGETVSTKRIDARTVEATFTRDGKALETARYSVSEDGKVLTLMARGTAANPRSFHNIEVSERQ